MANRNGILVSRTLYHMGYMTLVASIVWVGVEIYSATGKNFKIDVESDILEPINPKLDREVITALEARLVVEPSSLESSTGSATIEEDGVR